MTEAKRRSPLEEGLDELVKAKLPRYPLDGTILAASPSARFEPPTPEEISNYREQQYPGWLEELRSFFEKLPQRMGIATRLAELVVAIRNDGNRPSEGTIVTFEAHGGVLLATKKNAPAFEQDFPAPPRPPKGSLVVTANTIDCGYQSDFSDVAKFRMPKLDPHDPCAFYFTDGERNRPSTKWVFECDQFRHGGYESKFEMLILVPNGAQLTNPAVQCEVYARNMSTPVTSIIHVRSNFHVADSVQTARELLDRHLRPKTEVPLVTPTDVKPRD